MRIVSAKVIVTCPGRNFVTLKIVTDQGVHGIGDATLNGRETAVVAYLEDHVIPCLIGMDPQRIKTLDEMTDEEWERAFAVNVAAPFRLCRDAVPHMKSGASIINTASINSDKPSPDLLPYATSKGAIANFTAGLAQLLGEKGIRVNSVAPGPIWTPLIPSTLAPDRIAEFGKNTPLGRPGQPAELAAAFVLLASDEASYISGTWIGVTGGVPML